MRLLASLLISMATAALPDTASAKTSAADPNVRIYRCVNSNGGVSLQDAPCTSGRQQILDRQRPQDPLPHIAPPATPATITHREVRIVTVQPPQTMYECITENGERYTSDTADGNPHWVPGWAVGDLSNRARQRDDGPSALIGSVIVPYGSIQMRDTCHALPVQEACARLSDQRWELISRYNSALQSERQSLARTQRGIEARMQRDCAGL